MTLPQKRHRVGALAISVTLLLGSPGSLAGSEDHGSTPTAEPALQVLSAPENTPHSAVAIPAPAPPVDQAAVQSYLASLHQLFSWLEHQHGMAMLDAPPHEVDHYVRDRLARRYAMPPADIEASIQIIYRESGMRPRAANPRSSARMLGQWLSSTARGLGLDHPLTTGRWAPVHEQVDAFVAYVVGRYGSPSGAMAFWQRHHWY